MKKSMTVPGAPMRFMDPTLISDRRNGGAVVGPALKYHESPEWFRNRLREKYGEPPTPYSSVSDWLRTISSARWVDHWGTLYSSNGQSAFVAEPYELFPEDMQDILNLARAIECWLLVTATSSWYPTRTLRIEFWESQRCG